jgi:hypothetical protein
MLATQDVALTDSICITDADQASPNTAVTGLDDAKSTGDTACDSHGAVMKDIKNVSSEARYDITEHADHVVNGESDDRAAAAGNRDVSALDELETATGSLSATESRESSLPRSVNRLCPAQEPRGLGQPGRGAQPTSTRGSRR